MADKVIIDKTFLTHLRPEIDKALEAVGKRFGIVLHAASGTYGGATGSFKLEIAVPTETGETDPGVIRAIADWPRYCRSFGLKEEWLGQTTKHKGVDHKIIGLMPNRSKFPVLVRTPAGKDMLLTVEGVRKSFGVNPDPFSETKVDRVA